MYHMNTYDNIIRVVEAHYTVISSYIIMCYISTNLGVSASQGERLTMRVCDCIIYVGCM